MSDWRTDIVQSDPPVLYFIKTRCMFSSVMQKNLVIKTCGNIRFYFLALFLFRLDSCCAHFSGLYGFWREFFAQSQYWHAAQVSLRTFSFVSALSPISLKIHVSVDTIVLNGVELFIRDISDVLPVTWLIIARIILAKEIISKDTGM